MKKLYVSPDAKFLKIDLIEDVLAESNSTPTETAETIPNVTDRPIDDIFG